MINKLFATLIACIAAWSSCATTQPTLTKVEHIVSCAASEVKAQLPAILSEVATDLLSKDYAKLLADVGRRVGTDAMVCAVALASDSAGARMADTNGEQPNAENIRTNAAAYLKARDVHFAAAPMGMYFCNPTCDACHVCSPVVNPIGNPHLGAGVCLPRSPKPAGCP